jgi:hypothetical protein
MTLHEEILDDARRSLLAELGFLRSEAFYLAGGTALALQIGHRDSVDFDFFRERPIDDTSALFETLIAALPTHALMKTQEERNTLGILIDDHVQLSCMTFPYPLVGPLVPSPSLDLASIADIGCMKLNAITGRGAWKDYVDLYFITNTVPLETLIEHLRTKMPDLEPLLTLKSLIYFEDLPEEPIIYKTEPVDRSTIERTLTERVKAVS